MRVYADDDELSSIKVCETYSPEKISQTSPMKTLTPRNYSSQQLTVTKDIRSCGTNTNGVTSPEPSFVTCV